MTTIDKLAQSISCVDKALAALAPMLNAQSTIEEDNEVWREACDMTAQALVEVVTLKQEMEAQRQMLNESLDEMINICRGTK